MDQIFILHFEDHKNETSSTAWFWARSEAEGQYDQTLESLGEDQTITMYSTDVRGVIGDFVDEALGNGAEGLDEIQSSRKAEESEAVRWTALEFRPEGYFYIEMLGESEYWPFKVERYGEESWRVVDDTVGTPMAIIKPDQGSFKVVVNGYSQTKPFINLEGAVKFAITEFNG